MKNNSSTSNINININYNINSNIYGSNTYTNNKNLVLDKLDRPKKSKRLPEILSLTEVESLLNAIDNLKHKALLCIIYSAGLRIGEALNLKLNDIDSNRMLIRVANAKGQKDRYIPLSVNILELLRIYFKIYSHTFV